MDGWREGREGDGEVEEGGGEQNKGEHSLLGFWVSFKKGDNCASSPIGVK